MNRKDQEKFVRDLIATVQKRILAKLPNVPEEWNGMELRWLIGEHFEKAAPYSASKRQEKRYRAYYNETLVRDLF